MVYPLVWVNERDFDDAIIYCRQAHLVDGPQGFIWITPLGIDYVKREMGSRFTLSLNAEQILKYIVKCESLEDFDEENEISVEKVEENLHIDHDICIEAFQELEDEGLIQSIIEGAHAVEWGAVSTTDGRHAVRQNFKKETSTTAHIGQIFNAPINATNVTNVVDSYVEGIQQIGSQNDSEAIRETIEVVLNDLVNKVVPDLNLSLKAEFISAVAELEKEFKKSEIDPPSIHQKIISLVAFGDSLNGAFDLALKVAPYLPVLYAAAQKLLQP